MLFADETPCRCGQGWCPAHGTFHFAAAVEAVDEQHRADAAREVKRFRSRVVRKNINND